MFQFYKDRTFENLFGDTFGFIRQEFKPFITTLLKLTGPWVLLLIIGFVGYFNAAVDIFSLSLITYEGDSPFTLQFFVSLLVLMIGALGAYVLAQAGTLYYIDSYIQNNGEVNTDEVARKSYGNFFSFLGLGILSMLTLFVGFIFCLLPGFYFLVPMSMIFAIKVFQNKGATDAYSHSFSFIKEYWWYAFSFIAVLGIVIYFAGLAFNVPTIIYAMIKGFTAIETQNELGFMSIMQDPVYMTLNILNYALQFFLNFISIVGGAMLYFSIYEKKTQKGTLQEIDNLGT